MFRARVLAVLILVGCSNPQHPQPASCTVEDTYYCGMVDGAPSCCDETATICMGPDDEGYYCQPGPDPNVAPFESKSKRHRAHR